MRLTTVLVTTVLVTMCVSLCGASAAAAPAERYGLLPTLDDDGTVIALETIDAPAAEALRQALPEAELVDPPNLAEPWRAAPCPLSDAECMKAFAAAHELDGVVAIVLELDPESIVIQTMFFDGETGARVIESNGLASQDPTRLQAETRERVRSLIAEVRARAVLSLEVPDAGATVLLDGEVLGTSPLKRELRWLRAGRHEVRADFADGGSVARSLNLDAGGAMEVRLARARPAAAVSPSALLWGGAAVGAAGVALTFVGTSVFIAQGIDAGLNNAAVLRGLVNGDGGAALVIGTVVWALPALGGALLVGGGAAATTGFMLGGAE